MTIQTIATQRCRRKLHWEHEHVNISDGLMAGSVTVEEAQVFGSVAVLLFAQDAAPHPLCTKRTRLWMLAPSLYGPHFNVFLSLSLLPFHRYHLLCYLLQQHSSEGLQFSENCESPYFLYPFRVVRIAIHRVLKLIKVYQKLHLIFKNVSFARN